MAAEGEIGDISSLRMASTHPRDLLRRFSGKEASPEESGSVGLGEVELSLGLSLGGCFAEPNREKRPAEMGLGLVRSSSISFLPIPSAAAKIPEFSASAAMGLLARTCSLPVETEEWRRRKEMQSLKRMETKRKRSEKRAKERKEEVVAPQPVVVAPPPEAAAVSEKGEIGGKAMAEAAISGWTVGVGKPASQGSIGSQGSSSSVLSDFGSRPGQVLEASRLSNSVEVRSPLSPPMDHTIIRAASLPSMGRSRNSSSKEEDEPSKRRRISTARSNGVKETERNILEEMPCVSTKGDGTNGRRVEGFLYKYRKGEEVRIMCVCHGSFLTPSEFVKHAGGGDVDHPLRHIVVNPNPSGFS